MIPLAWDEIVALRLGLLEGDGSTIVGVKSDSRVVGPGDLFIALNSGVEYVAEARARGAATLVPHDQRAALAALAHLVRSKSAAKVVAVVGSTGKTSTKDILGALCAPVASTIHADASLNNEIGLPLTVCRLDPETEILVTEMGMRGLGQIAELCSIAQPSLTLITSIGPEHLERVGSIENVARANAEAIEALPSGGLAVVPVGVPELEPYLNRQDITIRRFDPASVERTGDRWSFRLAGGKLSLELPFAARHMAENTLAALTAYDALGLPLERAQEGAGAIQLSRWRGDVAPLPGGGFVVNDAYNANPTSMRAALLDLTERAGGRRRVAILGEMAELGDHADAYHREIASLLGELNFDVVVAVGERARLYLDSDVAETRWFPTANGVERLLKPGDAILVKASRAVSLEGVADRIANHARSWSAS